MVLIEGMEKPKTCEECLFLESSRFGITHCRAAKGRYVADNVLKPEAPPKWCPIREVQG